MREFHKAEYASVEVHPAFNILTRSIATDVEIYRFDISEDWHAGVRVIAVWLTQLSGRMPSSWFDEI